MNLLPPLKLLEQWRGEGLSPQEIYAKCEVMASNWQKAQPEQPAKVSRAAKQEAARIEKERQRQQDMNQVRSLREQQKTWDEISQALGKSIWYVKSLAEEAGLPNFRVKPKFYPRCPRKLPGNEELARLLQTNSVREICDFYNVTPGAVYQRLDTAGIPRRRYNKRVERQP